VAQKLDALGLEQSHELRSHRVVHCFLLRGLKAAKREGPLDDAFLAEDAALEVDSLLHSGS